MCDESGFGADKEPAKSGNALITFLVVLIAIGIVSFVVMALETLDDEDYQLYSQSVSVLALADTSY